MVTVARTVVNTIKTINGVPNTKTFTTSYDSKGNVVSQKVTEKSSSTTSKALIKQLEMIRRLL